MSALYTRLNSDGSKEVTRRAHHNAHCSLETWSQKVVTTIRRDDENDCAHWEVEVCRKDSRSGEVVASGSIPL